jgi:hypothetical protein
MREEVSKSPVVRTIAASRKQTSADASKAASLDEIMGTAAYLDNGKYFTLRALRNIGFIEAAKKGHITFVVFHILGPSIDPSEKF